MATVSAIVLAYNEAADIKRCLSALSWADERIVVDSHSTDATVHVARPLATKVLHRKFDDFSSQRNFAIEHAQTEWVLMIDADEVVTPELKENIKQAVKENGHDGYAFTRATIMYGVPLKSARKEKVLRLFRTSKGVYSNPVHEEVSVSGSVGEVEGRLLHYSMKDINEHVEKMNRYTSLHQQEKRARSACAKFKEFFRPGYRFFQVYWVRGAWRDGVAGLIVSCLSFFYEVVVIAKAWERRLDWNGFYETVNVASEHKQQVAIHKEFLEAIKGIRPSFVLDVGVGAFSTSSFFVGNNVPVIGLDRDMDILRRVKEHTQGTNVFLVCADAHSLPFKEDAIDVVYSQGFLEHFTPDQIRALLKEQQRICSKSVFFSVPGKFYRTKDFGNENLWSKKEWEKILKGFKLAMSKNYFFTRRKRNFLRKRPLMYCAQLNK